MRPVGVLSQASASLRRRRPRWSGASSAFWCAPVREGGGRKESICIASHGEGVERREEEGGETREEG